MKLPLDYDEWEKLALRELHPDAADLRRRFLNVQTRLFEQRPLATKAFRDNFAKGRSGGPTPLHAMSAPAVIKLTEALSLCRSGNPEAAREALVEARWLTNDHLYRRNRLFKAVPPQGPSV